MADHASAPPPVTPPNPSPSNESQTRSWHMWAHLSALGGLVVPFGNILGPLIVWQMKKTELPSIESHGKAALNFQLTVLIAIIAIAIIGFILSFVCVGFLLFFLIPVLHIGALVFAIIAGMKANEGKEYSYPYAWPLVR